MCWLVRIELRKISKQMFWAHSESPSELVTESCPKQHMRLEHNLNRKMQVVLVSTCGKQDSHTLIKRIAGDQ